MGSLAVRGGLVSPGERFTDTGQPHHERGLKWRSADAVRLVPIPPELVVTLRGHLAVFPPTPDGRVFSNSAGQPVDHGRYSRVFTAAKLEVFPPGSPLQTITPYFLRHANATLLLNARVPIPEIARRLGHSADVLLAVYAGVTDSDVVTANERIDAALDGSC